MYSVKSKLKNGFDVIVQSENSEYLIRMNEPGFDGPMDVFASAFSGCILMCVKGYFFRKYGLNDLEATIELDVDYENRKYIAKIEVYYPEFSKEDEEGVLANIKERCKISHLMSEDIERIYTIEKKIN